MINLILILFFTPIYPQYINKIQIQTYGSFATELCLPYSDIDLVVEVKYTSFAPNYPLILTKIENALMVDINYITNNVLSYN